MKQQETPDARVSFLTGWLNDRLHRLGGNHSVSTTRDVPGIGRVRQEDLEEAIWTAYLEILAALPTHPEYGIDREEGIASARSTRALANKRLRSRLIDHVRRLESQSGDVHLVRIRLVQLEDPVEDLDEAGDALCWADKVEDPRANPERQQAARWGAAAVGALSRTDRVLVSAQALGVSDAELAQAFGSTPAAVRKRRSRRARSIREEIGAES